MHRIVPIGASGFVALQALTAGSSAVSPEAKVVHWAATRVAESAERSIALFGAKSFALSQLAALAAECGQPGWDGQDASAVDPAAVGLAQRFVRILPEGIPPPEFATEPDGSVSMDWIASPHRVLSLSAGRSNRLAYAWLDGAERGHAVAAFDGQNVPPIILNLIRTIMGAPGHAGLRAA
jgi:hypothetical protein